MGLVSAAQSQSAAVGVVEKETEDAVRNGPIEHEVVERRHLECINIF